MRSDSSPTGQRSGSFTENARRQQIVGGAIVVLAEKGFNAASLAAIAEHLGMSKGVISYHFAGKSEVLLEVVRTVLAQAAAWMTPRVSEATSFAEALGVYIASNLEFLDAHRNDIFALTEVLSNARTTQGVTEMFRESQQAAVTALEALFAGGKRTNEFGDISPRVAAISLRAAIDSATNALRDEPDFDVAGFGTELAALYERATAR